MKDVKNINNYIPYHVHTELSKLDSCTNYKLYVDLCVKHKIPAIAFSEHGNIMNWLEKKQYCEKNNIKYIHACEVYLTEKLYPKERDNYHTVLISKNLEGFFELNTLISKATDEEHMYYKPRISFDEFLNTSDNIISTSACLASPLHRLDKNNPYYNKLAEKYTFYEIQPHKHQMQIDYNLDLIELSKKYNKPLIVGTDTHSYNSYKSECRSILQKAKNIMYTDEDSFDLTFKTYDELVQMFKNQEKIDEKYYMEAIQNTNKLNDMVETYKINDKFKYPTLYKNEEEMFKQRIKKGYEEKIKLGVIDKNDIRYRDRIKEEIKVYKKLGMCSFMLFMSELITWCHENDIPTGFNRGSVGGSLIAYLIDIIDLDAIQWDTIFSRFANEDRLSLGDIDIDFKPSDRERVYEYIINRFGEEYTCYILTTGTVADKGTIDEIARGLINNSNASRETRSKYSISSTKIIKEKFGQIQQEYTAIYNILLNKDKKALDFTKHNKYIEELKENVEEEKIKSFIEAYDKFLNLKQEYNELFYYFDGLKGTVISSGIHPAGIVASPITLKNNIGLMRVDGKWVSQINMDEIHDLNYVKYDILGLKNIGIIKDTYKLINSHYLKSHEVDWEDQKVWQHIIDSPVGIFQFEGNFAFDLLKGYISRKINNNEKLKINDLSLVNASLRPSGKSYRDRLIAGEKNYNPSKEIDELLADNNGFLVFQEDVTKFLSQICGLSGSEADNMRRAIAGKQLDKIEEALPRIIDGYCKSSNKPREVAEEEVKEYIQILIDASSYMFGYNHSTGYSMIGYNCGYLRYYYPLEFTTAYLNNADNEKDIATGITLADQLHIKILPPRFRYSKAEYMCDKEQNSIYKGVASIKFLNETVANELYSFKDKKYDSFLDLLIDINENTGLNSKQLEILIRLDYFLEFGKSQKLLSIVDLYNNVYTKKQIKKTDLEKLNLTEELMNKHSGKITEKLYKDIDMNELIKELINSIENKSIPVQEKIQTELEMLGYIKTVIPKAGQHFYIVTEIKTYKDKNKPYMQLYRIKNGEMVKAKVKKADVYKQKPFEVYNLIKATEIKEEFKKKKVDDKWINTDEKQLVINDWLIL